MEFVKEGFLSHCNGLYKTSLSYSVYAYFYIEMYIYIYTSIYIHTICLSFYSLCTVKKKLKRTVGLLSFLIIIIILKS